MKLTYAWWYSISFRGLNGEWELAKFLGPKGVLIGEGVKKGIYDRYLQTNWIAERHLPPVILK